jgi:hypothetical protein
MEKKKVNRKTVFVASALFIAIFAQVGFFGSVVAPIGQEHNIWGTNATAGDLDPGSEITTPARIITAWIDGVNYGSNWTWDDQGLYDLYVKGDDWGLDGYNYVKDGGWDGDAIYYFLDYDPMDYYLNISSHTSTFDTSAYELVDDIFFDTATYTDPALGGDTFLRGIKINEIVLSPDDAGNQYVYLYDREGELTAADIEGNYYLEKNDGTTPNGPSFDFSGTPGSVVAAGGGLYYVELPATDWLNSQDELKLVWENPGGSTDNICNGTDVIVDRVEWGDYHNNINPVTPPDDREYDNTTLVDYPDAPVFNEGLVRSTTGVDTDDCASDFTILTETGRAGIPTEPVMDYIVITATPGGAALPGGSVPSGFTEYGYCSAYNNTYGYMGVVNANWTVDGGDASLLNGTPNIHAGIDVGTIPLVDIWFNASIGGKTYSVLYNIGEGMPGAPTGLMVHKGGGLWGGIAGDLVLEWTAPTVDYGLLVANVVYYDMDLSDGFQYTTYVVFGVNATGAGTTDGCLLPGWDADANNYAFIVRTTGDVPGGPNENSIGTNMGYKYIITLQKNPSTGTQFRWISLPYYCDYTMASDICDTGAEFPDNTVIDLLVKWNFATQTYDSRYWSSFPPPAHWQDDFAINPGDALGVIITTDVPYDWSIVGSYDDTVQFELLKNPATGTQFMTMSLPYHKDYVSASDICGPGMEFTDNTYFDNLVQWNFVTQTYDSRYWSSVPPPAHWQGDFTINASPGDALGFIVTADTSYYWTPAVITV